MSWLEYVIGSWVPYEQFGTGCKRTFYACTVTMSELQVPTAIAQRIVIRFSVWEDFNGYFSVFVKSVR